MKDNKKNILLTICIVIITFMIIGITYAYFTSKAKSDNDALDVTGGKLTLDLEVKPKYSGYALIPLADSDIMRAYQNKCKDGYDNGACIAYDIILTNSSARQEVIGTINYNTDHIKNLSYLVLDENENIYQDITNVENDSENLPLGEQFILDSALETGTSTSRKFTLLVWVSDKDYEQTEDVSGTFEASVTYNSIYGQKLSTVILENERK